MNKIETIVYGLVKRYPGIKKAVKALYQGTFDLLPRKAEHFSGEYDFKEGYFFGFHDVFSLSNDETKCLANKVPFEGRMPQRENLWRLDISTSIMVRLESFIR